MNDSSSLKSVHRLAQAIYDKKGFNILLLDVRLICPMVDFVIIAEGTVERHIQALSYAVIDALAEQGQRPLHVEGQQGGGWIVLDDGGIVVHLFIPEWRKKYGIESLWNQARCIGVEVERHVTKGLGIELPSHE